MNYGQKPETVLRRADEYVEIGRPKDAANILYGYIRNPRNSTWLKSHEIIMKRLLKLCIEMRRCHSAKSGLFKYMMVCETVNIKSLDDMVRFFIDETEKRVEDARSKSQEICDVDDLDEVESPESVLMAAVSAEGAQERTDRVILTPWVKFLWEAYRQCLDLTKDNTKLEKLYNDVAKQAFDFCIKYLRKTELRKLGDHLRNHLGAVVHRRFTRHPTKILLDDGGSMNMHLETRLIQLDSAITMEQWMEAYKAVEDVNSLIKRSSKPPKASMLAMYYQKVSLIFWKCGNLLFNAAASHRSYRLNLDHKKNLTREEVHRIADKVLLSTLSIPLPPTRSAIDQLLSSGDIEKLDMEKRWVLAQLLRFSVPPTRQSLIRDMIRNDVLNNVSPKLASLYLDLEVNFDPLNLGKKVQAAMDFMKDRKDLTQYIKGLQRLAVIRLLRQAAQMYQTMSISRLMSLAPFVTELELQEIIVHAAKTIDLPVRLDHRTGAVRFGGDANSCLSEEVVDGPILQNMPGEQLKNQLLHMARALSRAMDKLSLDPDDGAENRELKLQIIDAYRQTEDRYRKSILSRRKVIEHRKTNERKVARVAAQKIVSETRQKEQKIRGEESKRIREERAVREEAKKQQEIDNIKRQEAEKRITQLKSTEVGKRALQGLTEEELAVLDAEDIMQKQVGQLEKEKRQHLGKLKVQEKEVDYLIRAMHLEEVPLMEKHASDSATNNRTRFEEQEKARITALQSDHEMAMKHKDRLLRMGGDLDKFLDQLKDSRQGNYEVKLADFNKKMDEVRNERLAERKVERKEKRRTDAIKAREERLAREAEEKMRSEREERLKKEREEQEARVKAQAEHLAKLAEIAKKQEAREAEIEAKIREQEANEQRTFAAKQQPGGWREREATKHDAWKKKDSVVDSIDSSVGNSWRDRAPRAGESVRGGDDDKAPSRGGHDDDKRAPARGIYADRAPPGRGGFDDKEPPSRGGFDDRGPAVRDSGSWRDRKENVWRGEGYDERAGEKDVGPRREDGPRRDAGSYRPPRGDDEWKRGGAPRDDQRGIGRDDFSRAPVRDDRNGGVRSDNAEAGAWRRGGEEKRKDPPNNDGWSTVRGGTR